MGMASRPRGPFSPPLRFILMKSSGLSCLTAWMNASLANASLCLTPMPAEAFYKRQKEGEDETI